MRFEFATATRIIFGPGTLSEVGQLVHPWGKRVLVVTGDKPERASALLERLAQTKLTVEVFRASREPSVALVTEGLAAARSHGAELVIGFGGGSVIDTAKAIAGLSTNRGDPFDYLEVVGQGKPLTESALPWMAIPTTAGTGAEVTRNAVLSVPERNVKVSLRSPHLLARVALVDPALTLSLPPSLTASTGLDALTQLIEAYVCVRANPLSDGFCRVALPKIARALPEVWRNPSSLPARTDVSFASLSSGLALANAGLGAVHGFAAAVGGRFDAPHGAICGALLAPVMIANLHALRSRLASSEALRRYREVAAWLTGDSQATVEDGIAWVQRHVTEFQLPSLRHYGVQEQHVPDLVARAEQASSIKGNPLPLTAAELTTALLAAI